uniref:hypothetical protein n=1 Tax=Salmonella enterica TaxID=28901 RepID=UPI0035247E33
RGGKNEGKKNFLALRAKKGVYMVFWVKLHFLQGFLTHVLYWGHFFEILAGVSLCHGNFFFLVKESPPGPGAKLGIGGSAIQIARFRATFRGPFFGHPSVPNASKTCKNGFFGSFMSFLGVLRFFWNHQFRDFGDFW